MKEERSDSVTVRLSIMLICLILVALRILKINRAVLQVGLLKKSWNENKKSRCAPIIFVLGMVIFCYIDAVNRKVILEIIARVYFYLIINWFHLKRVLTYFKDKITNYK